MLFRRALWLILAAIAAHNAEEYPKMVEYADRYGWRVWSGPAGTILPFLITAAAVRSPKGSRRMKLALTLPAVFAFNAMTHLRQTVRHRDYMSGTITGLAINVPLAFYIYGRALREGYLSGSRSTVAERLGRSACGPR